MKLLKKLVSVFLVMQVIASCVGSTASCWEFRKRQFVKKGSHRPKISVIVPVYKVEPWIRECLDSLKDQTLKDIEFICVDDGSPDNCGKILDEYGKNDKRFVIIHQKNAGVQAARNEGLKRATGEYITFVDSDDYLQLDAYEVAYKAAKKDDVDILQFRARKFVDGEDDHVIENNDYSDGEVMSRDDFLLREEPGWVWDKLFKPHLIKKDGVKFTKGLAPCDDTCFSYMVFGRAKNIKVIPTKLYDHRIREGSIVQSVPSREAFFLNNRKMLKYVCDDWKNYGYSKGHEHVLLHRFIKWAGRHRPFALNYAREVLDSFGPEILNDEAISKCDKNIKRMISQFKKAAYKRRYIPIKKLATLLHYKSERI